jgi:hypothetical protein
MIGQVSPAADSRHPFPLGSLSPEANRPGSGYTGPHSHPHFQDAAAKNAPSVFPHPNGQHHSTANYMRSSPAYGPIQGQQPQPQHQSPSVPQRPSVQTNIGPYGVMSPASRQGPQSHQADTPQSATPYSAHLNSAHLSFPPPFSLPPSNFTSTVSSATAPHDGGQPYTPQQSGAEYPQGQPQPAGEMVLLDNMAAQTTIPVFGSDTVLSKSPYAGLPEDFMAYLFNTQGPDSGSMNNMVPQYK